MKSNSRHFRDLSKSLLFQMEQWIALLVGVACLAVFGWAAIDGQEAFSVRHFSHFSATALASIGWSLTIAVGLMGIVLLRIAFCKQSEPEHEAKAPCESVRPSSGGLDATSNPFVSMAVGKRRQ